jgi:O-antigen/teichoic acid export membrane protein
VKRSAAGAVAAQGVQALASFLLQVLVARTLGISALGAFAILYGVVVLASGIVTGFVGDSLVVLDRHSAPIRSALQQFAVLLAIGSGAVAAVVTGALGLVSPLGAVLFAAAIAAFCLEEVVRRTLMADLLFWRVAAIDAAGLVVTMLGVGLLALEHALTLDAFLGALAVGQVVALVIGARVVRREERYLVRIAGGGRAEVAAYGVWRSLQQFLRPALLTAVRTGVGLVAGLAATGMLEAARVYVAPALLLVSGLSSYLFASFAAQREGDGRERLRRADTAVLALLAVTAGIGLIAVLALPVAGPALFRSTPDIRSVLGWLAYTASIAAVTPYGALAAVSGGQAAVFAVRAADTVLSLAAVLIGLALGMDPAWSAALLAIGSLGGGLVLRARSARIALRAPAAPPQRTARDAAPRTRT